MEREAQSDGAEDERLMATLAAALVITVDGGTVRLRELWRGAWTVTSFVRHFGCLFCHQMVDDLVRHVPTILGKGARVVIVGNGSPEQAEHFFAMKGLPREGVSVVTDPGRDSYKAAGFARSIGRAFLNPGSVRAYRSARREGHQVKGLFGDLTQLGGLMVVEPPARLAYLHRSLFAGDHPDLTEVVAVLP
jgi:hypothetical protein